MSLQQETHLFNACLMDSAERIISPALERGAIVISDRWYGSTFAYQHMMDKKNNTNLDIYDEAARGHIRPDLIFMMEADIDTIMDRIGQSDQINKFEKRGKEFIKKVISNYELFEYHTTHITSQFEGMVVTHGEGQTIEEVSRLLFKYTKLCYKIIDEFPKHIAEGLVDLGIRQGHLKQSGQVVNFIHAGLCKVVDNIKLLENKKIEKKDE